MSTCGTVAESLGYVATGSCGTMTCVNDAWQTDESTVLSEGVGWFVVIGASQPHAPDLPRAARLLPGAFMHAWRSCLTLLPPSQPA